MATLNNLQVDSTGALRLPVGTTAQRPSSPVSGMMRFNSDIGKIEIYNGIVWVNFTNFSGTITAQLSNPNRTGPTSIVTPYTGDLAGRVAMPASNGIQYLTIPYSGWYRIRSAGAEGGRNELGRGGPGAIVQGDFWLDQNEVIRCLVGSPGGENTKEDCDSGGGGGTYVVKDPYNTLESILVIAAGGGGVSNHYGTALGFNYNRPDYEGADGHSGRAGLDATNGRGGNAGVGGVAGDRNRSGQARGNPGGGFFGGGNSGSSNPTFGDTTAGFSYLDGGAGGTPNDADSFGGFGGGGGGHGNCYISGGGGGGFNGGGCQIQYTNHHGGCGGGSYNSGANQENLSGANYNTSGTSAFGYVYIERIG